jgi:beta-fructofuranosidase
VTLGPVRAAGAAGLAPVASPAFDELATLTGSMVRGQDRTWFMFYTGGTDTGHGVK